MKLPSIAQARSLQAQRAEKTFTDGYLEFQYRCVDFFVEHLGDLVQVFKDDQQQMLVLAVVGQVKSRAARAG